MILDLVITTQNMINLAFENCLISLANQTVKIGKDFNLIISDQSTGQGCTFDFCMKHLGPDFSYVYEMYHGPFNEGRARNMGFKIGSADHVLFADADLIFPLDFVDLYSKKCNYLKKRYFLHIARRHSRHPVEELRTWESFRHDQLKTPFCFTTMDAISREDFSKIGMYSELFEGWGGFDSLFADKCASLNFELINDSDRFAIHQQHDDSFLKSLHQNTTSLRYTELLPEQKKEIPDLLKLYEEEA